MLRLPIVFVLLTTAACGGGLSPQSAGNTKPAVDKDDDPPPTSTEPPVNANDDILEQLRSRPGLLASELAAPFAGVRLFELHLDQPVEHDDPDGATFLQLGYLLHVSRDAPMVLATTGYDLPIAWSGFQEEITVQLEANQLFVEERFFGTSRPEGDDWSSLTIENAAADHHAFVQKLKPIYTENWLATGHSKGGMTSVYHARFYPNDLDGVVAYVAPVSFAAPDARFGSWLRQLGDPRCADEIRRVVGEAAAVLPGIVDRLQANDNVHTRAEIENFAKYSIGIYEWSYWQYFGYCEGDWSSFTIDTADQALEFFEISTVGLDNASPAYDAYTYQTRNQLGFPDQVSPLVSDAVGPVDYPLLDAITGDGSWGVDPTYDGGAAMRAVQDFVDQDARNILFIYGGFDPWSGGQFSTEEVPPGDSRRVQKIMVPSRSHSALISDLTGADFVTAVSLVAAFAGLNVERAPDLARMPQRISPAKADDIRSMLTWQAGKLRRHRGVLP